MERETPREVNDSLEFFGIPALFLLLSLGSIPILFLSFHMIGLAGSFSILLLGGVVAKLPRGFFIHLAYKIGLLAHFFSGVPHGPVKEYRE